MYFSLEEGLHFFAFHPRFQRDRLERQKNHVYHVNPWPRPGIENTVFIIDEFVKSRRIPFFVIPAEAGIQSFQMVTDDLDSGFHRSDDFLRIHHY